MINYEGLFRHMEKQGISQYMLWKKYGVSKNRIYYMRHGKYVNTDIIDRLCGILSCKVVELVTIEGDD